MDTREKKIKVNVLGKVFEVSIATLEKIPYICDMWHGCGSREGDIEIERSPSLFKHVIALVIDDTYPFPAIYEQELRFYGVPYKQESLYHEDRKILDTLMAQNLQLTESIKWLDQKADRQLVHNKRVDVVLSDLCEMTKGGRYGCLKCFKAYNNNAYLNVCAKCLPYCSVSECKELTTTQYCDLHLSMCHGCNHKGCIWTRLPNTTVCIMHIKK